MAAAALIEQPPTPLAPNEKFFRYFQHEVTDLQEQMERLQNYGTSGGERADAVDHCLAGIARLSNEAKDASSYIPAYDQRTYGEAIKALSNKLQHIRSTFAPRPKFSFRSAPSFTARKNESAISLHDAAELADQSRRRATGFASDKSTESSFATTPLRSPSAEESEDTNGDDLNSKHEDPASLRVDTARIRQFSFSQSSSVKISDHDGLHIILPPSASHATSSGMLSNLHRCVVDMSSPTATGKAFAGLTLKHIEESLIICGHVNGAAHLTNLSNCVIVVASRQFRMHDSHKCDVYLLTASNPIIEDCSAIHFAPLPDTYLTEADRPLENQWQRVDDFKWLRSEPSPNWRVLDVRDRVPVDVWRDIVPGGPGLGPEDVLKAVKLPQ